MQDVADLAGQLRLLSGDRRQAGKYRHRPLARVQVPADRHVIVHGLAGKDAGFLEGSHDAARGDRAGLEPGEARPAIADLAACGFAVAGNGVERRRLAGAVGTDEGEHLALAHLEGDVVDSCEPAEAKRQPFYRERDATGAHGMTAVRMRPCHQRRTAGTMPSGRKCTIKIMSTPYITHCISGLIAAVRSTSGSNPKIRPPTIGPACVPLPPLITMMTMVTV